MSPYFQITPNIIGQLKPWIWTHGIRFAECPYQGFLKIELKSPRFVSNTNGRFLDFITSDVNPCIPCYNPPMTIQRLIKKLNRRKILERCMILLHIFMILQVVKFRRTFSSVKIFDGIDLLSMRKVSEQEGFNMC